jgi:hypothetical protein
MQLAHQPIEFSPGQIPIPDTPFDTLMTFPKPFVEFARSLALVFTPAAPVILGKRKGWDA